MTSAEISLLYREMGCFQFVIIMCPQFATNEIGAMHFSFSLDFDLAPQIDLTMTTIVFHGISTVFAVALMVEVEFLQPVLE